jgi:hypothetical protein
VQKLDMVIEGKFNLPGGAPVRAYCSECGPMSAWDAVYQVGDKEAQTAELFDMFGKHLQVKHRMNAAQKATALKLASIRTEQ